MRIKLDENLPRSLTRLLNALGYDTLTVYDQSLQGCDDVKLKIHERRALTPFHAR
jgi:predicted nuclease of predicted toxin-antitoxin system